MNEKQFNINTQNLLIKNGHSSVGDAIIVIFVIFMLFIPWIGGVVIAPTWWEKLISIPFFPYAWYLFVERLMQLAGLI